MDRNPEIRILKLIENAIRIKITLDQPLLESGLVDSITAVDIVLAVEAEFGITIPATEIGDRLKTARALVDYVAAHR
jgi:D-alanine--poly(phosphoribitol) ligase subunit 2